MGSAEITLLDDVSLEAGQLIASKYRLIRLLARGGMGAVWVARHEELEVDVALKFQREENEPGELGLERFRREARAAARLRSAHIVHVYDSGVHEGLPYIAMEHLEGEDLARILANEGRVPLSRALWWVVQAARGLDVAHRAGVVHRDIKPSNLFLAEQDGEQVIKLLDFGIAKRMSGDGTQTTTGFVMGSPAYMSPEQARGRTVDARSDLWSLSAVLYHLVTGVTPVDGDNSHDIAIKLCTEDVPAPSTHLSELGPRVDAFFARALSRNPDARFDSVDEFLDALAELDEGELEQGAARTRPSVPPWSGKRLRVPGRDSETEPIPAVKLEGAPDSGPAMVSGAATTGLTPPENLAEKRAIAPESAKSRVSLIAAAAVGLLFVAGLGFIETGSTPNERNLRTTIDAATHPATRPSSAASVTTTKELADSTTADPPDLDAGPNRAVDSPEASPVSPLAASTPAVVATAGGASSMRPAGTASPAKSAPALAEKADSTRKRTPASQAPGARSGAEPAAPPAPSIDPIFGLPVERRP